MTSTTAAAATSHASAVEEYRPHRKWYRRPDIMVPVVLTLIGFTLLIGLVEEPGRIRERMDPDGATEFDWMYFFHLVPLMFEGLLVTVKATLLGFTVAVVLGFFFALGRRSNLRVVRWPMVGVIEFIRSTPLLVQLFFWQALVRAIPGIDLDPITILMIGLGIHYATYCSEAYRAGINSVDKGQWEAATALNLGPVTKWTRVIVPQAVPNVLPALGNFLVAGFKDAPLGFSINVHGLLYFANAINTGEGRPVEPFLLVGVGFLLASLPAAWAVRKLERKIAYERV